MPKNKNKKSQKGDFCVGDCCFRKVYWATLAVLVLQIAILLVFIWKFI
ncbi:hypothetical protein HYV44_02420 [Candidatus Microgenomates bacterium]|nr:hypothetical protein [Candidatus Microgenomates bacterium]